MELVLKTSDSERNLGFESLTLRQKKRQLSTEGCRFFCTLLFSLFTILSSLQAVVSEKSEKRRVKRNGIPCGDNFEFDF